MAKALERQVGLTRRGIKIYQHADQWLMDAIDGGAEGSSRCWVVPEEADALALASDLMSDSQVRPLTTQQILAIHAALDEVVHRLRHHGRPSARQGHPYRSYKRGRPAP